MRIKESRVEVRKGSRNTLHYEDVKLGLGFRADLIVEDLVIIELKFAEKVQPVHKKQLMTYLKLTGMKLDLLANFNVNLIKDGIECVRQSLVAFNIQYGFAYFFAPLRLCVFARGRN
jgi:GxxExxY protein